MAALHDVPAGKGRTLPRIRWPVRRVAVNETAPRTRQPAGGNSKGYAQAYRFTAGTTGKVDRLKIFLDSAATSNWNQCSLRTSRQRPACYWPALLQPSGTTGQMEYREGQKSGAPTTYLYKTSGPSNTGVPAGTRRASTPT